MPGLDYSQSGSKDLLSPFAPFLSIRFQNSFFLKPRV
ncbi:hypothetical protein SCG7109_BG_00050 [Chlamydiales bacterium SCGC AG-110-M15]|nr:hypothetical protein SCG7109_BG_00050 [Chlamydiales bacterium SCGC AG-110-M15]